MSKGGARTSSGHTIPAAPSTTDSQDARPASRSDSVNGPSHPTSRKPAGRGNDADGGGK